MSCYNCKHRTNITGSAHSECNHPITEIKELMAFIIYKSIEGVVESNPSSVILTNKETGEKKDFIVLNLHGVRNGWAFWPFNFDPTWVISCEGFEEKEKEKI